jgi:hypothetical protein
MLIPVFLVDDDEFQEVPNYLLDRLIAMGRVRSFRRSSGWVLIGRDPVRKPGGGFYTGPERRKRTVRSCIACPDMVNGECISSDCPDRYTKTRFYTSV